MRSALIWKIEMYSTHTNRSHKMKFVWQTTEVNEICTQNVHSRLNRARSD